MYGLSSIVVLAFFLLVAACRAPDVSGASSSTFGVLEGPAYRRAAQELFATCMKERGFHVESTADGGSEFTPPPGQEAEAARAEEACVEQVRRLAPPRSFTDEELELIYQAQQQVATCLEGEGYDIPAAPSLESFQDSGGTNWLPYGYLPKLTEEEWNRLNQRCPQP